MLDWKMIMADSLKVLITTSGIGSRLGNFTKHSNKSLVKVGDMAAISHIINYYPKGTEFYITLGHNGDIVKQYLNIAHDSTSFIFKNVDNYEGQGSSLGYSLLQMKDKLQCPFIFHACDTLLQGDLPDNTFNWCAGFNKTNSTHYRTMNIDNSKIMTINPKGEVHYDLEYIGVSGIKDYLLFWDTLENLYLQNPNNSSLSDCDAIRAMLEKVDFKAHKVEQWDDIGNIDSLKKARKKYEPSFTVLDKEKEAIYFVNNKVIKFFSDSSINKKRVLRTMFLNNLNPPIEKATDNFYSYEFTDGELAASAINHNTIIELLNWANNNLWINKTSSSLNINRCKSFYFDKTRDRLELVLKQINKKDEEEVINGIKIPGVSSLIDLINPNILLNKEFTNFHGDFILDNIICTNNDFLLIDWRQDFAGSEEFGDVYYDLSKLNHNIFFNHKNIGAGLFTVEEKDKTITADLKLDYRLFLVKNSYDKWIKENGFDLKKVDILTSLIWINMSPLHEYPLNKFLYYFGRYNLFRALNENKQLP